MSRVNLAAVSTRDDDDDLDDGQLGFGDDDQEQGEAQRRGRDAGGVVATLTGADVSAVLTVNHIPAPYDAGEGALPAVLNDQERATLAVCEQALGGVQRAYILAGKALEVISRGRLYRETHKSLEAYVREVWGFERAHAYRWIAEWRLGAKLSEVSPRGDTSAVPEKHTRAALPVAKECGEEVAVASFAETATIAGQYGVKLTTPKVDALMRAVLQEAPRTPEEARTVVRAVIASGQVPGLTAAAVTPQETAQGQQGGDAGQDQAAAETDRQARAFAVLGAMRKDAVRMPDALAECGLLAFMHESAEAETMLRDLARAGDLIAHRSRNLLKSRGLDAGGHE